MNKEKLIYNAIKTKAYGVNRTTRPAYGQGQYDMAYEILNIVEEIINTEPKNNRWIPCSERLPSDEECSIYWINHPCHRQFICTVKIGDYGSQIRQLYFSQINGWKYGQEDYNEYVLAWQPLPQRYMGE